MLNNEVLLPFRCHEWLKSLKSPVMTGLFRPVGSLPLDGSGRLGGQVIEDVVDALDLGDDPAGDMVQQRIGDGLDGCGHGVGDVHRADDGTPLLLAVLHTHAL